MDKEILKEYAGYAGLGLVGGLVGGFLGILLGMDLTVLLLSGLAGGLGGWIAGVITKKWWGALVGGCILTGLVGLFSVLLLMLLFWLFKNLVIL